MTKKSLFIAYVVSLGGFLFGFDAGIISGVMSYVGPEFNLNDIQNYNMFINCTVTFVTFIVL